MAIHQSGKGNSASAGARRHRAQGSPGKSQAPEAERAATARSGGNAAKRAGFVEYGGGSSPLVPILIAIAVLAAISIGVVMMRQRRQRRGPGSSVSPKAS